MTMSFLKEYRLRYGFNVLIPSIKAETHNLVSVVLLKTN